MVHLLLKAMIEQAVKDTQTGSLENRTEARNWLLGDNDFRYVVSEFGFKPNDVLRIIRKKYGIKPEPKEEDYAGYKMDSNHNRGCDSDIQGNFSGYAGHGDSRSGAPDCIPNPQG